MEATKRWLLVLALLALSSKTFAQSDSTSYYTLPVEYSSAVSGGDYRGFAVTYMYTNLSNFSDRTTTVNSSSTLTGSESSSGTTSIGLDGVNLSYRAFHPGAMGYEFGVAYMNGMAATDTWSNAMALTQAFANVNYSFGNMHFFIGPNFSDVAIGNSFNEKDGVQYSPNLGGQIGVGIKIHSLLLQAGYDMIHLTRKSNVNGTSTQSDTMYGGLMAQIGFLF